MGMIEVEAEGMKGKAMKRVQPISVLVVACNGIAQVFHVDTNLVLPTCFEPHLGKGEAAVSGYAAVVGDGFLAAVVRGAAVGYVCLVVLEPRVNGAAFLLHLAAKHGNVSAVIDDIVPVLFEYLPYLQTLGINHQSACVAVEAVHDVGGTLEVTLAKVLVEDGLDAILPWSRSHAEDAFGLFDDDKVLVLVNNLDVLRGNASPEVVYQRIMQDRKEKIRRPKLQGENEWQHIQEQINLLELANIVEQDNKFLWNYLDE